MRSPVRPTDCVEMTGVTVAGWTVLERAQIRRGGAAWRCRHNCARGTTRIIIGTALRGPAPPKYCDGCRPRYVGKKTMSGVTQ
jgi:hypothetical protein